MHPSEFVGVESLAIAGFAARAAVQGRVLFQLFEGPRLLAVGTEAIEAQIHLTEGGIDALEASNALLHLGQVEAAGQAVASIQ